MEARQKRDSVEHLHEGIHLLQAVSQEGLVRLRHLLAEGDQFFDNSTYVLCVVKVRKTYGYPMGQVRTEEKKLLEDHGLFLRDVQNRHDLVFATAYWPLHNPHHVVMILHTLHDRAFYPSHLLSHSLVLLIDANCIFSRPRSFSTTCFFALMSITPYCSNIVEMIFALHTLCILTPTWFTCSSRGW